MKLKPSVVNHRIFHSTDLFKPADSFMKVSTDFFFFMKLL